MAHIVLLGAEKQAALSFATAWPERHFRFVSDQKVIAGGERDNVTFHLSSPPFDPAGKQEADAVIALCPEWNVSRKAQPGEPKEYSLDKILSLLKEKFPAFVLEAFAAPRHQGLWLVKGPRKHLPDASRIIFVSTPGHSGEKEKESVVYQEYFPETRGTFIVTGRCFAPGSAVLGIFRLRGQSFGREEFITAGETVENETLVRQSRAVLEKLAFRGFFTLNWIDVEDRFLLTSFRPVPAPVMRTLKAAGCDVLEENPGTVRLAEPGFKFTVENHYAPYPVTRK